MDKMDIPVEVLNHFQNNNLGDIQSTKPLTGGLISFTQRLTTATGSYILKQRVSNFENLYEAETEGLNALRKPGGPTVPQVLLVGPDFLLLQDMGAAPPAAGYWRTFGQQVAHLHSYTNDLYGFHQSNYLGILPMDNSWSEDGYEFFARTRILRFLDEPLTQENLTSEDRKKVENIAKRLPDLIPYQPPSLLHGDLWSGNMLVDPNGQPAVIDPGVYYGWPEAELSMTYAYSGVEPVFFEAYREVRPLEPGWEDRFRLLNIRELLSMIAHNGDKHDTVKGLRELLDRFA
jgi:fructosamine-3-kinase